MRQLLPNKRKRNVCICFATSCNQWISWTCNKLPDSKRPTEPRAGATAGRARGKKYRELRAQHSKRILAFVVAHVACMHAFACTACLTLMPALPIALALVLFSILSCCICVYIDGPNLLHSCMSLKAARRLGIAKCLVTRFDFYFISPKKIYAKCLRKVNFILVTFFFWEKSFLVL